MPGWPENPAHRQPVDRPDRWDLLSAGWFSPPVHDEDRVPRFAIQLEVRTDRPLKQAQLDQLVEGGHGLNVGGRPGQRTLRVTLEMDGGDVVGVLARSQNVVLDRVPGTVRHAEASELRSRTLRR
jgi:hypothetical protein